MSITWVILVKLITSLIQSYHYSRISETLFYFIHLSSLHKFVIPCKRAASLAASERALCIRSGLWDSPPLVCYAESGILTGIIWNPPSTPFYGSALVVLEKGSFTAARPTYKEYYEEVVWDGFGSLSL